MNTRLSLIRLYKWRVDEAQRKLAELYNAHRRLKNEVDHLEAQLLIEQAKASESEDGHFHYQSYAQGVLMQRESLDASLVALQDEISAALSVVQDAFREQKKVEIVEEQHQERARQKALRKSQKDIDEIAAVRFQRHG